MGDSLIHDRGRGPEIEGTRITVDTLILDLLDPGSSEVAIGRRYDLAPEQVAAARSYILSNPVIVLENYRHREEAPSGENAPEVLARAELAREKLLSFAEWLSRVQLEDETASPGVPAGRADPARPPSFKEWLVQREARLGETSPG